MLRASELSCLVATACRQGIVQPRASDSLTAGTVRTWLVNSLASQLLYVSSYCIRRSTDESCSYMSCGPRAADDGIRRS